MIVILLHKSSAWPFLSPLFLQLLDLLQKFIDSLKEYLVLSADSVDLTCELIREEETLTILFPPQLGHF